MVYPEEHAIHLVGVGGFVVHKNKLLLVKLKYGPAKGKFLIPGGYLEKGETLEEEVVREIKEETNVDVISIGLLSIRSMKLNEINRTDIYCILACQTNSQFVIKPQESEIETVEWVDLKNIKENEEVHPYTKYIVKSILSSEPLITDKKHNEIMKKALKLETYSQYWVP